MHGDNGSRYYYGSWKEITPGCWEALSWTIPGLDGELLDEAGVCFPHRNGRGGRRFLLLSGRSVYWDGTPSHGIDFASERVEVWPGCIGEISQFTRLKGRLTLEQGRLHLSCSDFWGGLYGRMELDRLYGGRISLPPIQVRFICCRSEYRARCDPMLSV